jgi:enoyl-CoA hydratase
MLLLGQAVTASEAQGWGLVNRVVPSARLRAEVDGTVARLLACGPTAVRLQKRLIVDWRETDLRSAIRAGIEAFAEAYATGEPREGAAAFLDKRVPRFEEPR